MSRTFVKRITHKSGKNQLFFREKDLREARRNGTVPFYTPCRGGDFRHITGMRCDRTEVNDLNFVYSRARRNRHLEAFHTDPIIITGECKWGWFWYADYYTEIETRDYLTYLKDESDLNLYEEQRRKEWAEKREDYLAMNRLNKVLATLDSDIRYNNGVDFL